MEEESRCLLASSCFLASPEAGWSYTDIHSQTISLPRGDGSPHCPLATVSQPVPAVENLERIAELAVMRDARQVGP